MKKNNSVTILAIETSCDDTCVAILKIEKGRLKILSNIISSQTKLHAKYGGVYPTLAKREHERNLPIILKKAFKEANHPRGYELCSSSHLFASLRSARAINLIAVTIGPGLEPCLWTGINFAKELAKKLKVPIMPVNHIEAHIFANFVELSKAKLRNEGKPEGANFIDRENSRFKICPYGTSPEGKQKSKTFPAVCLVVSGGHTQLILMKDFGKYKILGETRDDAAGECFDKTARILGLSYPGGPAIAAEAAKYKKEKIKDKIQLPRPMINQKNYDFSFSGLKTAVLYHPEKTNIPAMATEIQQAIIDVLIHKTIKAINNYKAKSIILGGGVSANIELKKQFKLKIKKDKLKINFLVPPQKMCLDNATMIGLSAYFHLLKNKRALNLKTIKADANLRIKSIK